MRATGAARRRQRRVRESAPSDERHGFRRRTSPPRRDRGGVYGWLRSTTVGRDTFEIRGVGAPPAPPPALTHHGRCPRAAARPQPSKEIPIPRPRRALTVLVLVLPSLVGACQPTGPTSIPQRTSGPGAATGTPTTDAEAGVITGRVSTEQGQPIAGAQIRIVGYTGSNNLGQDIETVTSGSDGVYRYEAGSGLYEVLGSLSIEFEGQEYVFDLEPADGTCDQELTEQGMVEDLVWRLRGVSPCWVAANPDAYRDYHGAPVKLWDRLSGVYSSDAVTEYTLQPAGALADGSAGDTLTMRRTVAALHTTAGPIDSTDYLYDIPLARYRVSATLTEAGAQPVQLLVATDDTTVPAHEADLTFDPRLVIGTPALGYLIANLTVYDTATGAR